MLRESATPWILVGIGLATTMAAVAAMTRPSRPLPPGRLVAERPEIVWRGGPDDPVELGQAVARFELKNVGGRPVRVIEATSTCGCARPEVRPRVVEPGGVGVVTVRAIPLPAGEKVATISLETDSPEVPRLDLRLRLIGSKRPPFLIQVGGDLTYEGDLAPGVTRRVLVVTIEPEGDGQAGLRPILATDLPVLAISEPTVSESPYVLPGSVQKTYLYDVTLTSLPPEGPFNGEVTVTSPWDPDHVERVVVHGQVSGPLRAVPARLVLDAAALAEDEPAGRFLVVAREPGADLAAEPEDGESSPLLAERVGSARGGKAITFAIRRRPGREVPGGVYRFVVRPSPSSTDRLIVPVLVRGGPTP